MIEFYHCCSLILGFFFELPVNLLEKCALKQPHDTTWMYRTYINAN